MTYSPAGPKKILLIFVLVMVVGARFGFSFWSRTESPLPHEVLTDLAPHPVDPSKLLVASQGALYLRENNQSWKRILSLPTKSVSIQRIVSHPLLPEKIFLLTQEGILEENLRTGQSEWVFREPNLAKNSIYALTLHPDHPQQLYVGTTHGLFQSRDGGQIWQGPLRWPENQPVRFTGFLPSQPPTLLLGTERELFFSQDGGDSFESGFSLPLFSGEDSEEFLEEPEKPPEPSRFTSLAFSSQDSSRIWVGTLEGVFESRDNGVEWERLPGRGLEELRILDLVFSDREEVLFAVTPKGVFQFRPTEKRWEKLPVRLMRPPTSLALQTHSKNNEEVLLVASGSEVIEWPLGPAEVPGSGPLFLPSPERMELFKKLLLWEPAVREIQKHAIRYGNLGNGKINRWHWASRLRAFVPRLTFSKDFSINENIDIDRGGTNDPDKFIHGPDEAKQGWGGGLTWELGDLLYSSAQTSIDSRAKLLVELRESLLSEVTRIYFERRRVQMEIVFSPPNITLQERLDLFLRLDELTAQIDALTDGFLSRRLEEIEEEHPEFKELFS